MVLDTHHVWKDVQWMKRRTSMMRIKRTRTPNAVATLVRNPVSL